VEIKVQRKGSNEENNRFGRSEFAIVYRMWQFNYRWYNVLLSWQMCKQWRFEIHWVFGYVAGNIMTWPLLHHVWSGCVRIVTKQLFLVKRTRKMINSWHLKDLRKKFWTEQRRWTKTGLHVEHTLEARAKWSTCRNWKAGWDPWR